MQITDPLAADLALLAAALYDPAEPAVDVAQTVLVFATNARVAVPSFVGLTITITVAGDAGGTDRAGCTTERVVLRHTLLQEHGGPNNIKTSLRLPGPADGAGPDQPIIQIVLYAARPGAFVDIAADICFLTGRELDPTDLDQHQGLAHALDITGAIQAETVIGEAVGVLIDRGRTHHQAHAELDTLAIAAHTDRTTEASRILDSLTPGGPETS